MSNYIIYIISFQTRLCLLVICSFFAVERAYAQTESQDSLHTFTDSGAKILNSNSLEPSNTGLLPAEDTAVLPVAAAPLKAKGTWTFQGSSTINTSQSQFSNWQGGGQNSISLSTMLNMSLSYVSETLTWESTLDAGYGLMLQGNSGRWFKNDDRFEITTKIGKKASKSWYYTALLTPSTQFQPGYISEFDTIPISKFFAPGYVVASLGFDYNPSSKISVFIGPVTSKNTFVLDQNLADQGSYGVEAAKYDFSTGKMISPGKKHRSETGGYMRIVYNEPRIVKNIGLQSKLELFSNYLYKAGNIDVDFENTFTMKVNEFISTTMILHFIYDDDIQIALDPLATRTGPRLQFKEVLAVGLLINL